MENMTQNCLFEIIDKGLHALKVHHYITKETKEKILGILQEDIRWD